MKFKKEYLILLLIIAALSVYLATRSKDQTHFVLPQPAKVESQKINRLVLTKDGNAIELTKKDDRWYIEPKAYAADGIKVKNMVKAAVDLTITDLISESGNYGRYDLGNEKKINVKVFADKELVRDFDIGKAASTYQHTFARLADDPNVYQARGSLSETFDHAADDLRDLAVLSFEKDDITALTVAKGSQSLVLDKKEAPPQEKAQTADGDKKEAQKEASAPAKPQPQWQAPDNKAVDKPAVERLLNDFSNFKCSGYLEDNAAGNLKDPIWTLTFKSDKGAQTVSVFEKQGPEATEYPARSSATAYAFTIAKNKVETMEKQIDKLLHIETEPKAGQ